MTDPHSWRAGTTPETSNIKKNRTREPPSFANINLIGQCNADCYFCLGKDIEKELSAVGDMNAVHFSEWKKFDEFLGNCDSAGIKNIYITGQNTDALLYKYIDDLILYIQGRGMLVGIRTNGLLADGKLDTINKCKRSVGYSMHTLRPDTAMKIMGVSRIPDWNTLLKETKQSRVAIVITRYSVEEFFDIVEYIRQFPNVKYIQARRICTDTRAAELNKDIQVYENLFSQIEREHRFLRRFYGAEIYDVGGAEVTFWRTVETTVNSWNYFVDGTVSKEYFIVEGYLKNSGKVRTV